MTSSEANKAIPAEMLDASTLIELVSGHRLARCIQTVAEFGIADLMDETPRALAALAAAAKVEADPLERILRLLISHGIFNRSADGYSHTNTSRLLRSDHPHSLRPYARLLGSPLLWNCIGALPETLKTGETAVKKMDAGGPFAYLKSHPEEDRIFNAAMESKAQRDIHAVMQAYDFSGFSSIADVGGGRGHLLKAILKATPNAQGVLFDQPHVVAEVKAEERMTLHPGDFFSGELPKCDAYVLMEVIHDWDDDKSMQIFSAIRQAAKPNAKVLIVETIVPEGNEPHFSKGLDIVMLVVTGGRERTRQQYEKLLQSSGFKLQRIVGTKSPCSIVEATVS
ncbi:MAG: O-methyltransferase [Acidobacteriales bacterium]|nr:O-methyltransferase [Terriglobales bacterium]